MTFRTEHLAEGVTLKREQAKARAKRYRARLTGEEIPFQPLGPRLGFKQSAAHVEKRKRLGSAHHAWQGDQISEKGGRQRALKLYPARPCAKCGAIKAERHHIDGDTANNAPENIIFLCRRCHMTEDGRLARLHA